MSIDTYADVTTKLSDVIAATEDPTVQQDHSTLASRVGQTGLLVIEYNTAVNGDVVGDPKVIGKFPANAIISGPVILQATANGAAAAVVLENEESSQALGAVPTGVGTLVSTSVVDGEAVADVDRDITLAATVNSAFVLFIPHIIGVPQA